MRVLLLGGLGVIGRATTEELLAATDHDLVVADTTASAPTPPHVPYESVDVTDAGLLTSLFERTGPDVVVNLAALVSFPTIREHPVRAADINLTGSLRVLEAADAVGARRVVFGSSKAVYGHIEGSRAHPEYRPVVESDVLAPRNPYDAFKVAAEVTGEAFAAEHMLDFIALRFGTIYGPGKNSRHGYSALFSRFVEAAVSGGPEHVERGGDQGDDLTYVRDCARAVVAAIEAAPGTAGAFNVATGRMVRVRDFVRAVRAAVPGADISIGDGLNYADETVSYRSVLSVDKAREVLGWAPAYDLATGVADYVAFERSRVSSAR
jgi:UDP-glucose 4-epimerase